MIIKDNKQNENKFGTLRMTRNLSYVHIRLGKNSSDLSNHLLFLTY